MFKLLCGVLAVVILAGCSSEESAVLKKADWLCKHNQLDNPKPEFFPAEQKPSDYIHDDDLAFLKERDGDRGGLGEAMVVAMAPAAIAVGSAMAQQTECAVTVNVEGTSAKATIRRTRPALDSTGALGKMGEIAKAGSADERLAKAKEWVATANSKKSDETILMFEKTQNGWRAKFDLKAKAEAARVAAEKAEAERRRVEAKEEIAELLKKKAASDAASAELAKFAVTRARFKKVKQMFGAEPQIEMDVTNGTGHPVAAAYFRGTLASPGRAVPWLRETFSYKISGGLESGESASWRLAPNMFSDWGKVEGAPDMVLTIEVLRLDGADGEPVYTRSFEDDDQKRLEALQASIVE